MKKILLAAGVITVLSGFALANITAMDTSKSNDNTSSNIIEKEVISNSKSGAYKGDIVEMHPPGGKEKGKGTIKDEKGNSIPFTTPTANRGETLKLGDCYYTLSSEGGEANRVSNHPFE